MSDRMTSPGEDKEEATRQAIRAHDEAARAIVQSRQPSTRTAEPRTAAGRELVSSPMPLHPDPDIAREVLRDAVDAIEAEAWDKGVDAGAEAYADDHPEAAAPAGLDVAAALQQAMRDRDAAYGTDTLLAFREWVDEEVRRCEANARLRQGTEGER